MQALRELVEERRPALLLLVAILLRSIAALLEHHARLAAAEVLELHRHPHLGLEHAAALEAARVSESLGGPELEKHPRLAEALPSRRAEHVAVGAAHARVELGHGDRPVVPGAQPLRAQGPVGPGTEDAVARGFEDPFESQSEGRRHGYLPRKKTDDGADPIRVSAPPAGAGSRRSRRAAGRTALAPGGGRPVSRSRRAAGSARRRRPRRWSGHSRPAGGRTAGPCAGASAPGSRATTPRCSRTPGPRRRSRREMDGCGAAPPGRCGIGPRAPRNRSRCVLLESDAETLDVEGERTAKR